MQLLLKLSVIGTSSSSLSTRALSIHTARLSASTTVIHSGSVTVTLPRHVVGDRSLVSVSSGRGVGSNRGVGSSQDVSGGSVTDCYEATVVLAKESVYVYGLTDAGKVTFYCNS